MGAGGQAIYAKENEITVLPGQRWVKWIRNDGVVMPGIPVEGSANCLHGGQPWVSLGWERAVMCG